MLRLLKLEYFATQVSSKAARVLARVAYCSTLTVELRPGLLLLLLQERDPIIIERTVAVLRY